VFATALVTAVKERDIDEKMQKSKGKHEVQLWVDNSVAAAQGRKGLVKGRYEVCSAALKRSWPAVFFLVANK
jgi:hypothetical protein